MGSSHRISLRRQLFGALVLPALVSVLLVAYFADSTSRRALEDALGDRLCSIAQSTATVLSSRILLLEAGDESSRVAQSALAKVEEIKKSTGVARIFVVRRQNDLMILDSGGAFAIGDEYTRARFDRTELDQVTAGSSAASVLFTDPNGLPYKTGYAPLQEDGTVVGYVGVEAKAGFYDAIRELRAAIAGVALFAFVVLGLIASVVAKKIAIPLSRLADAAQRIGEGDLSSEVPQGGPKESQVLAETMQSMATSLRAREEEMQMMLAGIAHEVRNPLGGIELFGGLLKEDLPEDDPRRKHVDKILRELGVLSNVVNDFLTFARKQAHETQAINIKELLEEVGAVSERQATVKSVTIAIDADASLTAPLEAEGMRAAVLNLVRNAIQASPENGKVSLRASASQDDVSILVEDEGPGVPMEKRKDIFAPFFTTKQKGTGLGLALVRKTVEAHGGSVQVENSSPKGARFVVRIPKTAPSHKRTT